MKNRSYYSCPSFLSAGRALLFLGMAGPVIWTITLSHTPLVSGRLWNTTVMLLKSDSAAEEGGGDVQRGGGVVIVFGFLFSFCALWLCTCIYEWSD